MAYVSTYIGLIDNEAVDRNKQTLSGSFKNTNKKIFNYLMFVIKCFTR